MTTEGGAVPRAVHVPSREPLPLPVGESAPRWGEAARRQRRRGLESLLRRSAPGAGRRVRHAIWHRAHLRGHDSLPLSVHQVPLSGCSSRHERSLG